MSARILILTAGFGEGHNAAARALATAAAERFGAGSARVVDVFALARPQVNSFSRRAYLTLINRAPGLWRRTYAWLDRSPRSHGMIGCLRREMGVLRQLIATNRPDVICSTYPLYEYMLSQLRRGGAMPLELKHYNVVTDSITINSLWWRAPCDGWFVPNEDSAVVLREAGVDVRRIWTLGFPVDPIFADRLPDWEPPALGPGVIPRVLYIVNSGTRDAAETARQLLAEPNWDVTCTVGNDEALRTELMRLATRRVRPTPVLGWTREIPRLLMTHHVVVSKAGGATTQEALAARCPMIVNQIVPGQEEGNYELLRRYGIGALAVTPRAVVTELYRAFAGEARGWRQWRAGTDALSRPNAAREIIAQIDRNRIRVAPPLAPIPALNS